MVPITFSANICDLAKYFAKILLNLWSYGGVHVRSECGAESSWTLVLLKLPYFDVVILV